MRNPLLAASRVVVSAFFLALTVLTVGAAEKKAGHSADQAVEAVSAALPSYPDRARLAAAIKAAFAEAP